MDDRLKKFLQRPEPGHKPYTGNARLKAHIRGELAKNWYGEIYLVHPDGHISTVFPEMIENWERCDLTQTTRREIRFGK